ncbi:unnamed protein product, partial [marine sediment metagenome]
LEGQNDKLEVQTKYNVLIIECTNSSDPFRWNEETKAKELIFP